MKSRHEFSRFERSGFLFVTWAKPMNGCQSNAGRYPGREMEGMGNYAVRIA